MSRMNRKNMSISGSAGAGAASDRAGLMQEVTPDLQARKDAWSTFMENAQGNANPGDLQKEFSNAITDQLKRRKDQGVYRAPTMLLNPGPGE